MQEPARLAAARKRALQLMAVAEDTHHTRSYEVKLRMVQKRLHSEFPDMRNLRRFIKRALHAPTSAAPHTPQAVRGRPRASAITLATELRACCHAVRKGRVIHGERWGIDWNLDPGP